MPDLDLCFTPATEIAEGIRNRVLSSEAVVRNALERIEQVNGTLNCFVSRTRTRRSSWRAPPTPRWRAATSWAPLHGVPIAIKDLTPTAGKRTTFGSYAFEHHVPERSALLVERLLGAGGIMVGKTATPEFAYSSFTDSRLWGVTRNPWDTTRSPGGSSGGSGAAVASGCVPIAEGTDMGGSVRIPASWSGVVGLKPSFGRIPLDFLPTQFDTIHHFGPLARSIDDVRLFLQAGAGPERARHHEPAGARPLRPHAAGVEGLRLALDVDLGCFAIDPDVEREVRVCGGGAGRRGRARRGGRRRLDARDPRRLERALGRVPGSRSSATWCRSTATGWIRACSRSWTPAAR